MDFLQNFPTRQKLFFLTPEISDFEKAYLEIRAQEGRLYPDEIVRQLPQVEKGHSQYNEWKSRKWNTQNLLSYLSKNSSKFILDLGCGNGWFTHQIATQSKTEVLGVDINAHELFQASRLFTNEFCQFAYGDIFQDVFPKKYFDTIILNSCIQYFPNINQLITRLQSLLKEGGEIHILDSPFYTKKTLPLARQRSHNYYHDNGFEKMSEHYFHHKWEGLEFYSYKIIYQPDSFKNKLRRKFLGIGTPFPWITITKTK